MGFSQQAQFPRNWTHVTDTGLTSAVIQAAGAKRKVTHVVVTGTSPYMLFQFRPAAGGTSIRTAATSNIRSTVVLRGFDDGNDGLQVECTVGAGLWYVTVFYADV